MRWLRSVLVVGLIASMGVLVRAAPACACSCVAFTDAEALERAEAVFAGTVVNVHSSTTGPIFNSMDPVTVTFEVSTVYKGDVPAEAKVQTVAGEVSCGYEFHEGTRYLVHVDVDQAGQWTTGLCSNNKVLPRETTTQSGDQTTGPDLGLPPGGHPPVAAYPAEQPRALLLILSGVVVMAVGVFAFYLLHARRRQTATGAS